MSRKELLGVRLTKAMLAEIDRIRKEVDASHPGLQVDRSTMIRMLIAEAIEARKKK